MLQLAFRSEAACLLRRPSTWRLLFDAKAEELARFSKWIAVSVWRILRSANSRSGPGGRSSDFLRSSSAKAVSRSWRISCPYSLACMIGTYFRSRKTKCTNGPMFP